MGGQDLDIRAAIKLMVANISKSFIAEWYTTISPTNHDFVVSCETLIEDALNKLADLCTTKLDKYKLGETVVDLIHDHIINDNNEEKIKSIESQIDEHEYDICQNSAVRLFGLLCTEELSRVIFTPIEDNLARQSRFEHDSNDDETQSDAQNARNSYTTSALYTLVIAMLTKAVFMPIVDSISEPKWLYAVIIWLCKSYEREQASKSECVEVTQQDHDRCTPNSSQANSMRLTPSIIETSASGQRTLDLEEGIDVATNINFENPVCDSLKRPLNNIEIFATEEVKSNNSCYVLYCIGYDGLCYRHPSAGFTILPDNPNVPIIDKRATMNTKRLHVTTETSLSEAVSSETLNRKSFRRRMVIKRRFREFVLLQLRLEENPKIRPYMKNIPKPTKLKAATQNIFSLPGITNIKLDSSTIKLRQRFLERFLVALNNSPFIANSYEFKEFFSYNISGPGVNISKSKSLILQVNFNKVFVDSLRSAYSLIRASLPGDDNSLSSDKPVPDPDAWLNELQQSTLRLHVQTRTSHSKMNLEKYLDSKLISMSSSPTRSIKSASLTRAAQHTLGGSMKREQDQRSRNMHNQHGRLVKSQSLHSNITSRSSDVQTATTTATSTPSRDTTSSRSSSVESIYYDAHDSFLMGFYRRASSTRKQCDAIQIHDHVPLATKLINIIHYSINGDSNCAKSSINVMARLMLGKTIEYYAIRLLELLLNVDTAAFSISAITKSIWGESDEPPLDVEGANLDEAVKHLTNLIMLNYVQHRFLPKGLMHKLIEKQLKFHFSQLSSQKRNKFVIYSFFVHLLDELESTR